jgi:hypothetical protein
MLQCQRGVRNICIRSCPPTYMMMMLLLVRSPCCLSRGRSVRSSSVATMSLAKSLMNSPFPLASLRPHLLLVAGAPSDIGQYFESLNRDLEQRQQQQQDVAAPVPSSPGPSSLGLWKRPCTPDRGSSPVAPECSPLTPKVQQQFLGGSQSDQRKKLEVTPTKNPTTAEDADVVEVISVLRAEDLRAQTKSPSFFTEPASESPIPKPLGGQNAMLSGILEHRCWEVLLDHRCRCG